MGVLQGLRNWWSVQTGEDSTPYSDMLAFLGSLVFHLIIVLTLGLWPFLQETPAKVLSIEAAAPPVPQEQLEELMVPEEFAFSDLPQEQIGANSESGTGMALSAAQLISEVSAVPHPTDIPVVSVGELVVNNDIQVATGLTIANVPVRGAAGEGTTGAVGAIDRITKDILLSLEERKTLVVWFFDSTASLNRQREQIRERFDRIYKELGVVEAAGNPAFKKHDDKPLLTSIVSFGQDLKFMTEKPTDDLSEIKSAVSAIQPDDSGVEKIFTAVQTVAEKYRKYRQSDPVRNIMFILITDEVGNDVKGLDRTVNICRRLEIPVYVVGVPAPFGLPHTYMKWVDPDPTYDQTPQWAEVDQGPESLLPETVKLKFLGDENPDPMDSGFGPYALTRLCVETGGVYFTVHPNRNLNRQVTRSEIDSFSAHIKYFFDPNVMRKYRPEYVSEEEYYRRLAKSKTRVSLVRASEMSSQAQLESPTLRFLKTDEAAFANALTEAQKAAAILEPRMNMLYEVLKLGEPDRPKESELRWQAGFDLAIGRVLAGKVRAEGYNLMLASAKRGLKFKEEKNNTWVLEPAEEYSTGTQIAKAGEQAKQYLERVVKEHPDTPWAMLAQMELKTPLGWRWKEDFTDIAPRMAARPNNNNNNNARPAPPRPVVLPKPPPKRSPPKL